MIVETIAEITPPQIESQQDSSDGTPQMGYQGRWWFSVEAVLIPEGDRATLCVFSQVGCSLDCKFCSTGKQGFQRRSDGVAEIIGQVWLAPIPTMVGSHKGRVVTNVVMMGMGEPLLNVDNVVSSMSLMCDDLAYGLPKRKVTLSTSVWCPPWIS